RFINVDALIISGKRNANEGCEECECSECCGSDCEAFTGGGSSVTNSVKHVGLLSHILWQFAHFCDTTCVVSDRAECINRELHRSCCHHSCGGDGHTVETCEFVRTPDASGEYENGKEG